MRTTINIADDVLGRIKLRARYERVAAGQLISDLLRQQLDQPREIVRENGIPVIKGRKGARKITSADVSTALDQLLREEAGL